VLRRLGLHVDHDLVFYLGIWDLRFGAYRFSGLLGFGITALAASMAENNPEGLTCCDSAAYIRVAQKENR
jgi:hypothetical protein